MRSSTSLGQTYELPQVKKVDTVAAESRMSSTAVIMDFSLSRLSYRSWQCIASTLSALSAASLLSLVAVFSFFSVGSALSIGSLGSVLSVFSIGSVLSVGCVGKVLEICL